MVVRHPELVEKARKKAEEARLYNERLKSRPDALARFRERRRVDSAKFRAGRDPQELRLEARERMRRLRSDPRKRAAEAEARRAWRADPENAQKVKERNARQAAKEKARKESDPLYRESQNTKQREYLARRLQDPEYRKAYEKMNRRCYLNRVASDPGFRQQEREATKRWKRSNPEKAREHKRRYRKNPRYRSIQALRKTVHRAVKLGQKRFCSSKYLGIDLRDAKQYIESMLRPGWTWDNHGKAWHIDHIFPIAKANLSDPVEVIAVSNYRNLQPLSVAENKAKKDKVTVEARLLFGQLKREAAATLAAAPAPA
jgi:hypothetical protein